MQTITCDVCKKKVDNPITDRTFFLYPNVSICEPCHDNLEFHLKPAVRTKENFSYEWYNKMISDYLARAVQKGR